MKIIKKKNIKIIIWKRILKLNKNYIKNFKIVFEVKNLYFKNNIIILNALNGSQHFFGTYKSNIKNVGWLNKIAKKFNKFKIICFDNINYPYSSTNINSLNLLNNKKLNKFLKIIDINHIKIKINLLKKINIKKFYINIGFSLGGLKNIILSILYFKKLKFSLNIATAKKNYIKNKIKNNENLIFLKNIKNYNNKKNDFLNIKNVKLLRKLNNINYISKINIKNKNKKIIKKNYILKKYKKNIFKYLNYKSDKFIKYFSVNSYISILKNLKFYLKIKKNIKFKNLKNIIIYFKNDEKFNKNCSLKLIKFNLKLNRRVNFNIVKSNNGHDSFLLANLKYFNILKNLNNFRSDKIWTYAPLIPNQVR